MSRDAALADGVADRVGAGLKMNVFGLDFAYLIPTTQANPLQHTLRFTLIFDLGGLAAEKS